MYPKDLQKELQTTYTQAKVVKGVSCEGFLGFENARALASLVIEEMDRWVDVVLQSADEPETFSPADHLLVVLQKL